MWVCYFSTSKCHNTENNSQSCWQVLYLRCCACSLKDREIVLALPHNVVHKPLSFHHFNWIYLLCYELSRNRFEGKTTCWDSVHPGLTPLKMEGDRDWHTEGERERTKTEFQTRNLSNPQSCENDWGEKGEERRGKMEDGELERGLISN